MALGRAASAVWDYVTGEDNAARIRRLRDLVIDQQRELEAANRAIAACLAEAKQCADDGRAALLAPRYKALCANRELLQQTMLQLGNQLADLESLELASSAASVRRETARIAERSLQRAPDVRHELRDAQRTEARLARAAERATAGVAGGAPLMDADAQAFVEMVRGSHTPALPAVPTRQPAAASMPGLTMEDIARMMRTEGV